MTSLEQGFEFWRKMCFFFLISFSHYHNNHSCEVEILPIWHKTSNNQSIYPSINHDKSRFLSSNRVAELERDCIKEKKEKDDALTR